MTFNDDQMQIITKALEIAAIKLRDLHTESAAAPTTSPITQAFLEQAIKTEELLEAIRSGALAKA